MKTKKFCVVGAGSIGTLALLETLSHIIHGELEGSTVTLIHEPDQPKVSVGEASTWVFRDKLSTIFGEDETIRILGGCKITPRNKSDIIWNSMEFVIDYKELGGDGIHFDSSIFSDNIISECDKLDCVNIVEKKVDVDTIKGDYDFVFDCTGKPTKEELETDYIIPKFNSVNSVLLYQHPEKSNDDFSSQISHENGWMFIIPLQHRKAYGYLYSNRITTESEARVDFKKIVPFQNENEIKKLNWEFYYRKNIIEDNVMRLGNKLYFFEPAGAMPIHFYYSRLNSFFNLYFINGGMDEESIESLNTEYNMSIRMALDLIALNYIGVVQDNKFWQTTKQKALHHLYGSYFFQDWLKTCLEIGETMPYWEHNSTLMDIYLKGYGIDARELI